LWLAGDSERVLITARPASAYRKVFAALLGIPALKKACKF
jgi:hypothetical protein